MPTVITQGAASAKGYGFGASATAANYIEDVFSTYLYTGNGTGGATQTITNGIDLSGKGGMVWIKGRSAASDHIVGDTVRGAGTGGDTKLIEPNLTAGQNATARDFISSYSSTGFVVTQDGTTTATRGANYTGVTYAAWTFRKQAKFFDIVTYTGTGANRTVSHNLGSVPGCIIIKRTDGSTDWTVYHRSIGNTKFLALNLTNAETTLATAWNNTTPTSTTFSLGTYGDVNANGGTYVAYLFAHDAGGFGATGSDNVISCGSWTDSGSGTQTITLGYEPQFLIYKRTDASSNWVMLDTMRGWPVVNAAGSTANLYPNLSNAESGGNYAGNGPTATGFTMPTLGGGTYIYIAIRRGPMKTPTTGTSVFATTTWTGAGSALSTDPGIITDLFWAHRRNNVSNGYAIDRLRNNEQLYTERTNSGSTNTAQVPADVFNSAQTIIKLGSDEFGNNTSTWVLEAFRRAPGFFDIVCYKGGASTSVYTQNHNLGVVPELMIVKRRDVATANWIVWAGDITKSLILNTTAAVDSASGAAYWNSTNPTATQFSVGGNAAVNNSSSNYVAYLFATVAGVSKVGSYTGTGTTKQIDCGFTGGARFVLIKRTDSTGDWYVWDSARGIVAGNDPYLLLNSNAAEVTNTDYIDTYSAGFEISSTAPAAINANGGSFVYLAIS